MGVRVDGAAGPLALGAKSSVRDRLTPPGRIECSALGRYEVPFHWGGTAPSAPFFTAFGGENLYNRPDALWGLRVDGPLGPKVLKGLKFDAPLARGLL